MTGEVSAAESNEQGLRRANRVAAARRRNPRTSRDFHHQIVVPLWMDGPYIRRYAKELGCSKEKAITLLQAMDGKPIKSFLDF